MLANNPLVEGFLTGLRMPSEQSLTAWAEENRYMAAATAAQPGPYRCGDAVFQREMQDSLLETGVEQVICMTSAQVGKTTFLLNGMLYFSAEQPSPQLVVLPKDEAAEAFASDFFEKTVEASPRIAPLFRRSKKNKQKTQHKQYPGGQITFVGANVPANLAMRPIRCVWGDEIDRWPRSAGQEGDPVNLAIKRTTTFANRKIVLVSTPTLKEGSRIAQLYASQPGGVDQVDLAAAALQTFAARIAELETDMHEVPAIYCHPDDFAWAESIHSRFQAPRVPLLIASNSVPRGQIIAAHYNRGTGIPVPAVVLERAA